MEHDIQINHEKMLTMFGKSKEFDFLYDGSPENEAQIWEDIEAELAMSIQERASVIILATGLSGSGKSHTFLNLVGETVKKVFRDDLEVRACEFRGVQGICDLSDATPKPTSTPRPRPTPTSTPSFIKGKITGWSGVKKIKPLGDGYEGLMIAVSQALQRRSTNKTQNNDT